MGRTKEPARGDILRVLNERGAQTMKQIADATKHSTRTVARHLKELEEVKKLDLRRLGTSPKGHKGSPPGYSKKAPRVFYQIETLGNVPHPYKNLILHKKGRVGVERAPIIVKGPLNKNLVDEDAWFIEHQYKIKRPWSQERK